MNSSSQTRKDSPTKFMVKGERCSGTTYLENLIKSNLNLETADRGWKHGYINFDEFDNFSGEYFNHLIIFIFRNSFDWLRSFYLMPHHLEGSKAGCWVEKPTFSEFIRKQFRVVDESKNERMLDVHPFHMSRPKNLIELRRWKSAHWLEYEKLGRPCYYLRYEDLVQNPESVVNEINGKWFGRNFEFKNWTNYKNSSRKFEPKKYFKISDKDMSYIVDNLDWELERRIGYEPPERSVTT